MRADHVVTVTPASGYCGDWKPSVFCDPGAYAIGYRMRVESSQGNGDDTALNSVQLFCSAPPGGLSEFITSYDGLWGSWHPEALCGASGVLTGRFENNQGTNADDSAMNGLQLHCCTR